MAAIEAADTVSMGWRDGTAAERGVLLPVLSTSIKPTWLV